MKVFLAHNFYGSSAPSGENTVFLAEAALLKEMGHDVVEFTRHSDEIRGRGACGIIRGTLSTPWNPFSAQRLEDILRLHQPDILHVHNFFPLLSPAIFHAAAGSSTATVLTLHNYRLFCPAGIPMRAGRVCTDCLDRHSVLPALRHGCYRNSRLATAPLSISVALHRLLGTWRRHVDAFIALSEFQKDLLTHAGLAREKIYVKPNFYPGNPAVVARAERKPYVIFVGRLGAEKGLETLLLAWRLWGDRAPELRVAGEGELRLKLEGLAAGMPVRFLGQIPFGRAQEQIGGARILVLPSECFEGFPMAVREALALGTPAAVSDLGPLPSIIRHGENGVVFAAADPAALLREVRKAWDTPGMLERLGQGARRTFEKKYTAEANYRMLMSIYDAAIQTRRRHNR